MTVNVSGNSESKTKYPVITISSWQAFREVAEDENYRSWGFRGQANAKWLLYSSLSRYLIETACVHRDAWDGQEERILRIFRRKAHLFLQHVPSEDDSFEWLALMQHHGAPTGLLDVTWSPYVALFFAIERGQEQAAVWAFNASRTQPGVSSIHYSWLQSDSKPVSPERLSTFLDPMPLDSALPKKASTE